MSNYKDNNADLGNQTIEGTEPPPDQDMIFIMPSGPSAAEPEVKLDEPVINDEPVVIEPVIVPQSDDLSKIEAQLDDIMKNLESQPDNGPSLDEQLAAMLADDHAAQDQMLDELNAKLDALLSQPDPEPKVEQPTEPTNKQNEEAQAMMEQARQIMEQAQQAQAQAAAQMQAAQIQAQATQAAQQAAQQAVHAQQPAPQTAVGDNGASEAARLMMQQAQTMLQQAQEAQMQAQKAAQEAQLQAQRAAQEAQMQAQKAAHEAQLKAQAAQASFTTTPSSVQVTDPYAQKEVDRLNSELSNMRELVNKLTYSLAQNPASGNQGVQQSPLFTATPDHDQFKKLEAELESMRREILEKDLRDREKELDRRQKEAESNNVKDIRPEMVQMSETRDVAPIMSSNGGTLGGEFIPIAEGVYYSTKNKQVYVMTPAANAAAASPTIERPRRAAPAKKRRAAPARPSARRRVPLSRRRPMGAPSSRRRPPSRPTHR